MFAGLLAEKRDNSVINLKNLPKEFIKFFGGGLSTTSGKDVNEEKALGLTAVWACVSIISRTMASLPLPVYRKLKPTGKERVSNNPLYALLNESPNPEQTSYEWRSLMSIHQNLWGAGISEIEFDKNGQPIALWPIPPWRVTPARTKKKELIYKVSMPDGPEKTFYPYEVVVFQSMTTSRDYWMSPISVHRETIGSALAVKEFGARTFGQGVNPAGIISGVKFTNEEAHKTLTKEYAGYEGLGQAHRLMFVDEGHTFEKIGLPPQDAQYLETKQFDISEVARMFHMPLFMLQEHTKSTSWGKGLEEQKNGFVTFTILPGTVQWEQELNRKLIFNKNMFCEFLLDGLLRGNIKDRMDAYTKAFNMGLLSLDEIRELENRNPIENDLGKTRFVPLNMTTLEKAVAGETEEVEIPPTEDKKPTEDEDNEDEDNEDEEKEEEDAE